MDVLDASGGYESQDAEKRLPKPPFIHYETLVWFVFGILTVLAVVDRFTLNVWPRETYSIGAGIAASDFKDGLKDGPWTVQFYDIVARVSGRYSIIALNLLLFTMMRSTASWLSESWFGKRLVDFSNIAEANLRLHKWNGITLVVMTLVHVWSILLPAVFNGWRAQVLSGSFEWILSERKPQGFKDVNVLTKTVSLQVDDVFRIVEMTLLLAILIPLSIRWLGTRWHLGIHVHRFIAVIYFIDIVRRHTHPHSWILNTPFFVLWLIDHFADKYWRRHKPDMYRLQLSEDYILLFWNQDIRSNTVGPKYYLKLRDSSLLEHAHTFTGFENRCGIDLVDGRSWSACLLVRVYHNRRRPRLGKKDKYSHTKRVAEATNMDIYTWGPFNGSMSEIVRLHLQSPQALTLVAGGSAAGYIIDAIQQHGADRYTPLTVLYTCRDAALFQWMTNLVRKLIRNNVCEDVNMVIAVTDGSAGDEVVEQMVVKKQQDIEQAYESSSSPDDFRKGSLRVQYGRINFTKEIPSGNVVLFQGSGGLQHVVGKATKANGSSSKFIAGPAFDQDQSKRENILGKLRMNCLRSGDTMV